jgi:hypothetical protein
LVGPIIITKKGSAYKESGGPADVDRELFILPTIFDENESHFIDENMAALNVSNPAELVSFLQSPTIGKPLNTVY